MLVYEPAALPSSQPALLIEGLQRIVKAVNRTTRAGALVMPYIERAAERREELRRLVDAARQKRRVRELDVASEMP